MPNHFHPGDHVALREIWHSRVWTARPYTVVEDTPDRLLLYAPAGVRWMKPVPPDRLRGPTWRTPGRRLGTLKPCESSRPVPGTASCFSGRPDS